MLLYQGALYAFLMRLVSYLSEKKRKKKKKRMYFILFKPNVVLRILFKNFTK